MARTALIVGAGSGISASVARALSRDGYRVALAARKTDKLKSLAADTGASLIEADAADAGQVKSMFAKAEQDLGPLDVVLYNASFRTRGPFIDLDSADVARTLQVSAYGGFLVGQEAARRMLERQTGVILFTGASASVKGYAQSAPFAMGKDLNRSQLDMSRMQRLQTNQAIRNRAASGMASSTTVDSCSYQYRRWRQTRSGYWRDRYYDCID